MLQEISLYQAISTFLLTIYMDVPTIRETSNGRVEGAIELSKLDHLYYSFRGIPYAEAPITGIDPYTGEQVDRRFKAPEPVKRHWSNALKVHDFGKKCIQAQRGKANSSDFHEDCLFLNIYVPVGGAKQKTVLMYIPGGGFNIGDSTSYGPDFLLTQDNIVVTVQYRLGIFGFLNLEYGEYTGNMGLKDQQMALAWVHENVEHFSGKRDGILLFGESAGGASVHFHMLNKKSRKYFNRAFASSGSAFNAFAIRRKNHLKLIQNCAKSEDTDKLIDYLKMTDMSKILYECCPIETMKVGVVTERIRFTWAPTIEMPYSRGAFLTKTPSEIYNSAEALMMDSMFSFNAEEMVYFHENLSTITESLLGINWRDTKLELPFEGFTKQAHPEEYIQAVKLLKKSYFPNETSDVDEIRRRNIGLLSDANFVDAILKAAVFQTNANNKGSNQSHHKNTFLFRFSVQTELNQFFETRKVTHADDVSYTFWFIDYGEHLKRKDFIFDIIMRNVKMITNFARTGNPSVKGATPFKSCKSSNQIFCQEITNDPWTNTTTNIKEQLHYETWREIENIYENLYIF